MMSHSLRLRLISGFTLGPLTLVAIFYGGFPFQVFVALAFGISVKEWINMSRLGKHVVRDAIIGIAYLLVCFFAMINLRLEMEDGLFLTICLLLGVWSSDIAAYCFGKLLGGPKLAVKISPNKTWAGFIGGMIGSAGALALLNHFAPVMGDLVNLTVSSFTPSVWTALGIGVLFTVFGQIGDLLISSYKRKVGVKDTGTIIPGHGGILDRIDSLLLVSLFFLVVLQGLNG